MSDKSVIYDNVCGKWEGRIRPPDYNVQAVASEIRNDL